jgi:hypothetical protein
MGKIIRRIKDFRVKTRLPGLSFVYLRVNKNNNNLKQLRL